jgi:OmpA-OmpF porin, OOP family
MWSQRTLLGLVVGMATVGSAEADSYGTLRWRAGAAPLGLQAGSANLRVPCGTMTFSCDAATLPLYASPRAPRTLSMQVGPADGVAAATMGRNQGLNVGIVGQAGIASDLGVYGRVGTSFNRAATPGLSVVGAGEGGLTYGVGLSWDFSRSGSAALGLDSHDMRGSLGEARDVRTSLGLRWRY